MSPRGARVVVEAQALTAAKGLQNAFWSLQTDAHAIGAAASVISLGSFFSPSVRRENSPRGNALLGDASVPATKVECPV